MGGLITSCGSKKNITTNDLTTYNKPLNHLKNRIKLYSVNYYPPYEGKIISENEGDDCILHYRYDSINYKVIISQKYYLDYLLLFENGILHPILVSCFRSNVMSIGQFRESINPQNETKRIYKLWSWCEGVMSPCEYTIELSNEKANSNTQTKDFVKDAIITYISACSVII